MSKRSWMRPVREADDPAVFAIRVMMLGALLTDVLDATLEERVLLMLGDRMGSVKGVDLAWMLGVSKQTMSRTLAEMRRRMWLEPRRNHLTTEGTRQFRLLCVRLRTVIETDTTRLVSAKQRVVVSEALRAVVLPLCSRMRRRDWRRRHHPRQTTD